MGWRIIKNPEEPEGYTPGSGIVPDLVAADGCQHCHGDGFLVCIEAHLVIQKQVNTATGEERILGQTREQCFGHLCKECQPIRLLVKEKLL